jgi:hypothetical protein
MREAAIAKETTDIARGRDSLAKNVHNEPHRPPKLARREQTLPRSGNAKQKNNVASAEHAMVAPQ